MRNIFEIKIPDNRNFGLDLLRFIAILTVLIGHSTAVLTPKYYFVHRFIFDGVLIFFVLSGFLIGRILIRDFQEGISAKKLIVFWTRRWFRTLPAYYFTVLLIIVLLIFQSVAFNKIEAVKNLIFIQNIYYRTENFFPESWSLSIEEWFYLTVPFMIFILNRILNLPIKINLVVIFIVVLLFSLSVRSYIYYDVTINSINDWDMNLRSPVITRLDSLLMGVLGAWFFIYKKDFFVKNKNLLFTIGIIIFTLNKLYIDYGMQNFDNFYICVPYFTIMPLSVLLTIPFLYYIRPPVKRVEKIISRGSLISYSMYLVNLTMISAIILRPLHINMWLKFILFWVLTVVFSILMYKYIEIPFMKLRDKK